MKINDSRDRAANSVPPPKTGRRFLGRPDILRLVLAALLVVPVFAGAGETRRLRSGDPPEYPELAKKLRIRGIARVQLTVAPDGSVKAVKELGGNPVLIDALLRAVKKWKYEAANETSNVEVKFVFPTE
ncbi:MAG TPA: energy transducer TonB [Verrucomicrobiae bacterium]|nr:energy transducer TonB [Verrucomicrobiae bacterium]